MKRALLLGTVLLTAATLGACTNANPAGPDANLSPAGPAFTGMTFGSGNADPEPGDATTSSEAGVLTYGSGNDNDAASDSASRGGMTYGSGN